MVVLGRSGLTARRQLMGTALAVLALPLSSVVMAENRSHLTDATPVLVMLLVVVAIALIGGLRPAAPAAIGGGLLLNYYFTKPFHQLTVARAQDLLVLAVYLAVAVSVSVVVDLAARRTAESQRASAEARALGSVAGEGLGASATLPALLERVREAFGASEVSLLAHRADTTSVVASVGAAIDGDVEQVVPAGPTAALRLVGPQLFAPDLSVLGAFAEASATALEGRRLAEQAATAEAVDRLRTVLLAAVGHDLRTPLAGAKAAVSSLRQTDITWGPAETAELLETIEESVDRLQGLVSNLLDASRLQVGALSVTLAPVLLEEVVAGAVTGLHGRERVTVDVPETLPPVTADAGLLERVVGNLVDNALRHAPGPVTVVGAPRDWPSSTTGLGFRPCLRPSAQIAQEAAWASDCLSYKAFWRPWVVGSSAARRQAAVSR